MDMEVSNPVVTVKLIITSDTLRENKNAQEITEQLRNNGDLNFTELENADIATSSSDFNNPSSKLFYLIFAVDNADFHTIKSIKNVRFAIDQCMQRKQKNIILLYFNERNNVGECIEKLLILANKLFFHRLSKVESLVNDICTIVSSDIKSIASSHFISISKHASDIGASLAWAYFFGFLVPLLKGFRERFIAATGAFTGSGAQAIPRYVLLITSSCNAYNSLKSADSCIEPVLDIANNSPLRVSVVGERLGQRSIKSAPAFYITDTSTQQKYIITAEIATPQLVLREAAESWATDLSFISMLDICDSFTKSLRKIVDGPSCLQFFEDCPTAMLSLSIVEYDDVSLQNSLSSLLLSNIKRYQLEERLIASFLNFKSRVPNRNLHGSGSQDNNLCIASCYSNVIANSLHSYFSQSRGMLVSSCNILESNSAFRNQLRSAKKLIIVIDRNYVNEMNNPLAVEFRTLARLFHSDDPMCFLQIAVVIASDIQMHELPKWESRFGGIVVGNEAEMLTAIENNWQLDSQVNIYTEPVNGAGLAFAMNAFFGFLKILMNRWKSVLDNKKDASVHRRYILIIPSNCNTLNMNELDSRITKESDSLTFSAMRGGQSRPYNVSLYKIVDPRTGRINRFAGEVCQPLLCFAELVQHQIGEMHHPPYFTMQKCHFRNSLSQLLSLYCEEAKDFYQIVEYLEPDPTNPASRYQPTLSQVLLDIF